MEKVKKIITIAIVLLVITNQDKDPKEKQTEKIVDVLIKYVFTMFQLKK